MARTVTVSLSTTTPKINQAVHGQIAVASSDTNPVQVAAIAVYTTQITASCEIDLPDLGAGGGTGLPSSNATKPTVVNNGGTLVFPFRFIGFQPQVPGSSAIAYQINAVVTFSDGQTATGNVTANVSPLY